jgi:hypothetical protein
VSHVLDTALSPDHSPEEIRPGTWLVGWQYGFEPLVVAVIPSYTQADADEAVEIATDWLTEILWFSDGAIDPDYCIQLT